MKKNLLKLMLIAIGLQLSFASVAQGNIVPMPDGLYFAKKNGNICYFDGEKVVDTQISAGAHTFQLASWHGAIYGVDAGEQYTYVNDTNNNLGDGELFVVNMRSDNSFTKKTIVNNKYQEDGNIYHMGWDPYHIMIDNDSIYYTNRTFTNAGNNYLAGVRVIPAKEVYDVPYQASIDVPFFVTGQLLPY